MRLSVVICGRVLRAPGTAGLGRAAPPLCTVRVPGIVCAVRARGACVTALGAIPTAWEAGRIAPRPCACMPAGRKTTRPARMIWRTIDLTLRPELPGLSQSTFPQHSITLTKKDARGAASDSFHSAHWLSLPGSSFPPPPPLHPPRPYPPPLFPPPTRLLPPRAPPPHP